MSVSRRQSMVDSGHDRLSVVRQCSLLKIARSGLCYERTAESAINLTLMQEIDRAFTEWPFLGVRQMSRYLVSLGYSAGRKRVRRLMRLMGLMAVYQKPRTSGPYPEHKRYPYLLRDLDITRSNQSGALILHTFPCERAFCIWSPSWTGTVEKCCPGDFPTPWRRTFVSRLWKRPWRNTAGRIYSTLIRAASSPVSHLRAFCEKTASVFPWTDEAAGWTMYSLSAFGARSNMRTSI